MTIGFEEDSPFYDGPVIDTREDVNATEKVKKVEDVQEVRSKDKKVPAVEEKVTTEDKKEIEVQEEVIQKEQTTQEPTIQEGETTFSYERDDD